ncbi:LysR family transcriptional regulator [Adlercreutzia sp. R25]|uniref:LysR family transcriptional regulator n=1 Tax=Adlercreutzia shanghongiae TaxID=3111773 RepID=UPI002DBB45C3|nr:LysR family transcriptional regulator [Adlercreutzia sp. R25]MEC4271862.1 LysR family transcriptional regulator [Adlercreutzia sp. R25]
MDLFEMRQFLAVAEGGTMTAAAKELFVSQPTLSHNLKKIEAELGCQLFDRSHNRMQLTACGEIVRDSTLRFFEEYDRMLEEIRQQQSREAASLRLGCFAYGTGSLLVPMLAATMPEATFAVRCCSESDLLRGLASGEFDAVIASSELRRPGYGWQKLYNEQAFVSVPCKSELSGRESLSGADLVPYRYVINDDVGFGGWYKRILDQAGVPEESVVAIPFRGYLQSKDLMPEFSLITSFVMNYMRTSDIRAVIPLDEPYARRDIGLLTPKSPHNQVKELLRRARDMAPFILSGNASASFSLYQNGEANFTITA